MALTDAGKMLYEQARQIMSMLQKIEAFSDLARKTCFHIASEASNFLSRHFAEFVAAHDGKEYCMKMWERSIRGIMELVEQGEAELGFFYIGQKQVHSLQALLHKKGLVYQKLLPAQAEICLGKHHPLAGRKNITVSELQELEYVCLMEDSMSKMYHLHQLVKNFQLEKNMEHAVQVESKYALINLLSVSDRVHLCYGSLQEAGKEGLLGIRAIPIEYEEEQVYLGYISQEDCPLSPIAKEFLALLGGKEERE